MMLMGLRLKALSAQAGKTIGYNWPEVKVPENVGSVTPSKKKDRKAERARRKKSRVKKG